jgi:molybdenum cofactor cytidylyltransferase
MKKRVVGVVLAAGMATRMGRLKQLLPIDGRTAIERIAETFSRCLDDVVVVLGHRAAEIKAVLASYPVRCQMNPSYRQGMLSSVQCGISSVQEADAYVLGLGDQPGVGQEVIEELLQRAWCVKHGIIIPCWDEKRGHPILLKARYRKEIISLPTDQGLNAVTRGHPEDTLEIPFSDPEIIEDMDTPADYRRMVKRLEAAQRRETHG